MKLLFYSLAVLSILSSCQKDHCKGTICLNGSTCVKGVCECPIGYIGEDCGTKANPKHMIVEHMELELYPTSPPPPAFPYDSDGVGRPDVYVILYPSGLPYTEPSFQTPYTPDSEGTQVYDSNFGMPWAVYTEFSTSWNLGLMDEDLVDADDFMGSVQFNPIDYAPLTSFVLQDTLLGIKMNMTVSWVY